MKTLRYRQQLLGWEFKCGLLALETVTIALCKIALEKVVMVTETFYA